LSHFCVGLYAENIQCRQKGGATTHVAMCKKCEKLTEEIKPIFYRTKKAFMFQGHFTSVAVELLFLFFNIEYLDGND